MHTESNHLARPDQCPSQEEAAPHVFNLTTQPPHPVSQQVSRVLVVHRMAVQSEAQIIGRGGGNGGRGRCRAQGVRTWRRSSRLRMLFAVILFVFIVAAFPGGMGQVDSELPCAMCQQVISRACIGHQKLRPLRWREQKEGSCARAASV